MSILIKEKKIHHKSKDLNPFDWNILSLDGENVWVVLIDYYKDYIYIDRVEIYNEYRGKWIMRLLLEYLFDKTDTINICASDSAIWFWLHIWAYDNGRWALKGDRDMTITKAHYYYIKNKLEKPFTLNVYYTIPYNQSEDTFEDDTSQLYKTVWNEHRLPLWTKLYKTNGDLDDYYALYAKKWNVYSLIDNWNEFIIPKDDLKVTRYSYIKYEEWYHDFKSKYKEPDKIKEEFAKSKYDALVNGEAIIIY